jgi:hypothetical protein
MPFSNFTNDFFVKKIAFIKEAALLKAGMLLAKRQDPSVLFFLDGTCIFQSLAGRCYKLCTEAWPQYALGDQEKWPSQGSLNYSTILQLDLFYKSKKKKVN